MQACAAMTIGAEGRFTGFRRVLSCQPSSTRCFLRLATFFLPLPVTTDGHHLSTEIMCNFVLALRSEPMASTSLHRVLASTSSCPVRIRPAQSSS